MDEAAPAGEPALGRQVLKRAVLASMAALMMLILAAMQTYGGGGGEIERDLALPSFFAMKQDIPVGTLALVVLALWWVRLDRQGPPGVSPGFQFKGWQAGAILFAMALGIWLLRTRMLPDFDLSRDERMVGFDAAIFAGGRLFQPIPPFWRDYYDALNINFILPIGNREAWVSSYLPGNAALRALLGMVLPASAIGAVLVLAGGAALWRIAARLWPESASTRAVVLVLYVTSSQVILTGTTAFAMTAHLTANLIWLWLFLQRRPIAHAGAIAVGFVATGLHQPLFHPLFVAPFLLLLLRERAWKELAAYTGCYLAIGLFWIGWQPWLSAQGLQPVPAAVGTEGVDFISRLSDVLRAPSWLTLWVMAANLLRFVTWNALLLAPLAAVTLLTPLRSNRFIQALWLGPAGMLLLMAAILPWQGYGWGYRYLHHYIGSFVLLAGFGWHWLEARQAAPRRALIGLTALWLAVLLPLQVWMADGHIRAYAAAAARIKAIDADVVIVDDGVPFAQDLVFNRADLSNRPIMLAHSFVSPGSLGALCRGRTLGFADAPLLSPVNAFFGLPGPSAPTPHQQSTRDAARAASCRIVPAL